MYIKYLKILSSILILISHIFNITENKFFISLSSSAISTKEKSSDKSENANKHQKKNCSVFNYIISKTLKKEPKCKEEDLNIPSENDLLMVLKTISDLAEEGKIDFKDALSKEIVYIDKSKAKESIKRIGDSLKNAGNNTDHFIIKLMGILAPILISINGGKFDLGSITKLIRNYSQKLKNEYGKKSNNTVKKLVWKDNKKIIPEERGIELQKVSDNRNNLHEKFKIKTNGFGPLLKKSKEKLINIAKSIIPPQGFTKLKSFKDYYIKKASKFKGEKQDLSLQIQKSIQRDIKMDGKMCGIVSLIKATQINNESILDEKCAKVILSDYVDVGFEVSDMRQRIKKIFNISKPDNQLSESEKRKLDNFTAIAELGITNCKFIKEIGLLPTDLVKEYGKIFNLKLFSFETEQEVIKALKSITKGNQNLDKAVIVTPLIFWGNVRNECGMHYLNIIHIYDDGTFLVEDTDGTRYKPINKFKKNLVKLMRLNIKKSIGPFLKEFNGLIDSSIGKETKTKILEAIEIFVQERMGGAKSKYCFIVSDPKNVVKYSN
ncbi:MAG: hypothetical protein GY830_06260 [Bacteroidetes bacterium]|nr:hypothetical protein [Bacteroidota bacterium]